MSSGALHPPNIKEGESLSCDTSRVTPVKRRRLLLNLVDLRGPVAMTSSLEVGVSTFLSLSQPVGGLASSTSLGHGRRSRTPLKDLDSKFVTKSVLGSSIEPREGNNFRTGNSIKITHLTGTGLPSLPMAGAMSRDDSLPRFPRLDQCAHFHYEYVELPPIEASLVSEDLKPLSQTVGGGEDTENRSLLVQVTSLGRSWVVRRTYDNFRFLDKQLHRCCYDRKYSQLMELPPEENLPGDDKETAIETALRSYLTRLSDIAGSLITCGPVLSWLELDNRGHRLIVTDDSDINTPAVAAAYVVKRYVAQASDEISFEVGDMISVIDMPPPEESIWWRGKRGFQVGFFPCECVQVIGDKVPQAIHPQSFTLPSKKASSVSLPSAGTLHHVLPSSASAQQEPIKPVLRKHGKLIAFFRSFILSRPSRRKLKQSGILRERVFGCDLGEHLLNSGHEIPMVLKCCAEFIENHGTVDGIYRLSGITSNIQKLRNAFDEERVPDLYGDESILQDIHCVSSVLKMYFRELPNPLLTYQLYDKFVAAVMQNEDLRLLHVRDVVQQLPPPHYRTLEYLIQHLARVATHSSDTGMTPRNIAIVWAPNLLRSKDLEKGGVAALQDVGTQAVVTEYLVRYVDLIFNDKIPAFPASPNGPGNGGDRAGTPKKMRPKSLAISTPTKLLSLDQARSGGIGAIKSDQRYIEVGGGPQNLPKTYHTVIDLPSRKGGSLKQKKSPLGWKTLFSKNKQTRKSSTTPTRASLNISDPAVIVEPYFAGHMMKRLRPVKSVESLVSTPASQLSTGYANQVTDETPKRGECSRVILDRKGSFSSESSSVPSPRTHNRSVSHDSYFNLLERSLMEKSEGSSYSPVSPISPSDEGKKMFPAEMSPESSKIFLDISELNIDFDTSEPEMKIFSEDDTLKSTSLEDTLSRSTVDIEENISVSSDVTKSKESVNSREKRSLKDILKKKFTSPSPQRREMNSGDSCDEYRTSSLKRASSAIKEKIVYALSPETLRRKSESPGGSPKSKIIKSSWRPSMERETIVDQELNLRGSERLTIELDDSDTRGKDIEDERGRVSIESALIDDELMDKITRLRVTPTLLSDTSSESAQDTPICDVVPLNFSLGTDTESDDNRLANKSIVRENEDQRAYCIIELDRTASDPSISQETHKAAVTTVSLNTTRISVTGQDRPNSLVGITESHSTGLRHSLTSPETPQGDSLCLDFQYHPLSDTTEPSTPSEKHSDENPDAEGPNLSLHLKYLTKPSSPLSPDLSCSSTDDDSTSNPLLYENLEGDNVSHSPIKPRDLILAHGEGMGVGNYKISPSDIDTPTAGNSEETEYENIEYNTLERSNDNSNLNTPCYENIDNTFPDMHANTTHSQDKLESLTKDDARVNDTSYEECSFPPTEENSYENVQFSSFHIREEPTRVTKTEAEIEGEIVYQQVKYLRKSIQEVNEILNESPPITQTPHPNMNLINGSESSDYSQCQNKEESHHILKDMSSSKSSLDETDENECLDSPVSPSSSSLVTEVRLLPSFSSPTESNNSSSERGSSPDNTPDTHVVGHPAPEEIKSLVIQKPSVGVTPSPDTIPNFIPALTPPNTDFSDLILEPVITESRHNVTKGPESNLTCASTPPCPRPRTVQVGGQTWPPVPKPRNLSALSPSTPTSPPTRHGTSEHPNVNTMIESFTSQSMNLVHLMKVPETLRSPTEEQVVGDNKILDRKASSEEADKNLSSKEINLNSSDENFAPVPILEETDSQKRERIEKYKRERRSFLREKFKSESFKGEKDDMILRLKQKATSPSRQDSDHADFFTEEDTPIFLPSKMKSKNDSEVEKGNASTKPTCFRTNNAKNIYSSTNEVTVSCVNASNGEWKKKDLYHRSISEDSKVVVVSCQVKKVAGTCPKEPSVISPTRPVSDSTCDENRPDLDDINVKQRLAIWRQHEHSLPSVNKKVEGGNKISVSPTKLKKPPHGVPTNDSPGSQPKIRKISGPPRYGSTNSVLPTGEMKVKTANLRSTRNQWVQNPPKTDKDPKLKSKSPTKESKHIQTVESKPRSASVGVATTNNGKPNGTHIPPKDPNVTQKATTITTKEPIFPPASTISPKEPNFPPASTIFPKEPNFPPASTIFPKEPNFPPASTIFPKEPNFPPASTIFPKEPNFPPVSSNLRSRSSQGNKFKDMKALFERDSAAQDLTRPLLVRPNSRE